MSLETAQRYIGRLVEHSLYAPERHVLLVRDLCEIAYPATGEQDRRTAGFGVTRGELLGLALALGGHRPDPGVSTVDRMTRALNENVDGRVYRVYFRDLNDAYEVHRIK